MAAAILSPLTEKFDSSFFLWSVPSYLVLTEKEHNPDA